MLVKTEPAVSLTQEQRTSVPKMVPTHDAHTSINKKRNKKGEELSLDTSKKSLGAVPAKRGRMCSTEEVVENVSRSKRRK